MRSQSNRSETKDFIEGRRIEALCSVLVCLSTSAQGGMEAREAMIDWQDAHKMRKMRQKMERGFVDWEMVIDATKSPHKAHIINDRTADGKLRNKRAEINKRPDSVAVNTEIPVASETAVASQPKNRKLKSLEETGKMLAASLMSLTLDNVLTATGLKCSRKSGAKAFEEASKRLATSNKELGPKPSKERPCSLYSLGLDVPGLRRSGLWSSTETLMLEGGTAGTEEKADKLLRMKPYDLFFTKDEKGNVLLCLVAKAQKDKRTCIGYLVGPNGDIFEAIRLNKNLVTIEYGNFRFLSYTLNNLEDSRDDITKYLNSFAPISADFWKHNDYEMLGFTQDGSMEHGLRRVWVEPNERLKMCHFKNMKKNGEKVLAKNELELRQNYGKWDIKRGNGSIMMQGIKFPVVHGEIMTPKSPSYVGINEIAQV